LNGAAKAFLQDASGAKVSGQASKPMINPREKLRVDKVASETPKSKREKHEIRVICWVEGLAYLQRKYVQT